MTLFSLFGRAKRKSGKRAIPTRQGEFRSLRVEGARAATRVGWLRRGGVRGGIRSVFNTLQHEVLNAGLTPPLAEGVPEVKVIVTKITVRTTKRKVNKP